MKFLFLILTSIPFKLSNPLFFLGEYSFDPLIHPIVNISIQNSADGLYALIDTQNTESRINVLKNYHSDNPDFDYIFEEDRPYVNTTFNISNDIIIKGFNYKIIDHGYTFPDSRLCFAKHFPDEKESIIHTLFNQNLISKKKFYFIPESDKNGKFILGENPNLLKEHNINQKLEIPLSNEEQSWKFNLDNIIIENISINGTNKDIIFNNDNNSYVHIQTYYSHIYAPLSFINILDKHVFEKYYKNGSCKRRIINTIDSFTCSKDVLDKLPDFIFTINGKKIKFKRDIINHFQKDDFIFSPNFLDNTWIFGHRFLRPLITELNYDNNEIVFYSDGINAEIIDNENYSNNGREILEFKLSNEEKIYENELKKLVKEAEEERARLKKLRLEKLKNKNKRKKGKGGKVGKKGKKETSPKKIKNSGITPNKNKKNYNKNEKNTKLNFGEILFLSCGSFVTICSFLFKFIKNKKQITNSNIEYNII